MQTNQAPLQYAIQMQKIQREKKYHGTAEFPCASYSSAISQNRKECIPWHWHEEMELLLVKQGTMLLRLPFWEQSVRAGQLVFINRNVPHYAEAEGEFMFNSIVFSSQIIGEKQLVFGKYIEPFLQSNQTQALVFEQNQGNVFVNFLQAYTAMQEKPFAYEYEVRYALSKVMLEIISQNEHVLPKVLQSQDAERLEQMLAFIHSNYKENIYLKQIAQAANVGERECLRCFQRSIKESPIQYLLRYRLMQSADLLHKQKQMGIAEVSEACGFSTPSYFAKQFKMYYLKSPHQYRRERSMDDKGTAIKAQKKMQ